MEYRQLGRTGLKVSAIGLGTEHLGKDRENLEQVLRLAVGAGVNYVDLFFWEQLGSTLACYREHFIVAAHWEGLEEARSEYARLAVPASACTGCGVCVELCPFGVDILAKMRQAVELFGS